MKKIKIKVSIDEDVDATLQQAGDKHGGLSSNQVLAIAAYELARAIKGHPENLWHVLGRIASDDGGLGLPGAVTMLPAPQKRAAGARG